MNYEIMHRMFKIHPPPPAADSHDTLPSHVIAEYIENLVYVL